MKILLIISGLVLIAGCRQPAAVHEPHDLKEEMNSRTAWSSQKELFVTYPTLVLNKSSVFTVFLSELQPFYKPYDAVSVTASLIINGKGIKTKAKDSKSPGIYSFVLKPGQAGKGTLRLDIERSSQVDQFVFENIEVYDKQLDVSSKASDLNFQNSIPFSKNLIWKHELASELVTRQPVTGVIKASGQIISAPGQEVTIAANSSGILRFANKSLMQGTEVIAGRELFSISGGDINTAENIDLAIQQANLEARVAADDYNRSKQLMEDQLITRDKYQQAMLHYQNSNNKLKHLKINYGNKGKRLVVPFTGYIKDMLVQEGQYVTAGQPLATITKNQKVLLQVNVPLKEVHRIPGVVEANFVLQQGGTVFNTKEFNGRIISVAKTTLDNTPWFPLYFDMDFKPMLIPGSYADVFLKTDLIDSLIVVPREALLEEQGHYFLYIQTGGESFERRDVEPGNTDGKKIQIIKGLVPGERIVTKGSYQIKLSTTVDASKIHDHAH